LASGNLPHQVLLVFDLYVYPYEELEAKLDVFPPFVFVLTVIPISTILIKSLGLFEEDQWYIAFSLSFDEVRLKFF